MRLMVLLNMRNYFAFVAFSELFKGVRECVFLIFYLVKKVQVL